MKKETVKPKTMTQQIQEFIKGYAGEQMTDEQCLVAAKWVLLQVPQGWGYSLEIKNRNRLNRCKKFIKEVWVKFVTPIETNSEYSSRRGSCSCLEPNE